MPFLERDLRLGSSAAVASELQVRQVLPIGWLASQLQRLVAGAREDLATAAVLFLERDLRPGASASMASALQAHQVLLIGVLAWPAAAVRRRRRARGLVTAAVLFLERDLL